MLLTTVLSCLVAFPVAVFGKPWFNNHNAGVRSTSGLSERLKPKVLIISMFSPEAEAWYGIPEFDLLARNITVTGFSPLFPHAHCTEDGSVCQVVTGEAEINAAATITALTLSPHFDLRSTYFLIAGTAGVNPKVTTIGSVTFARYAVQVTLQYEIDARELPPGFTTGYFPQGSDSPNEYPQDIYGTEVFEVNDRLRSLAVGFARTATLNDSRDAVAYRAKYAHDKIYASAAKKPSIVECDTATSDVYWTGALLSEAFENTMRLFTNGTGVYCTAQQEDNATLEALLRSSLHNLTDFSRIIVMRTASDFDRPYIGGSVIDNLLDENQGYEPALRNIYLAGVKVVEGILKEWTKRFEVGTKPSNYIGDIFASLGGIPDFGTGSTFGGGIAVARKRDVKRRRVRRG
ncbi:hypothetical protein HETIRDRAFT_332014 [Heterobasidion irregulare TC 32-1]|uniref:Purine nucleoside permease n=1 Tax=Heterobasidion irregulare (strain TC 32-1) TaxID=747525 RepID=W4JQ00_HETIT|nr:uncharacterized protein HETIRDRAFT_332014 [Heterobasidion irregulare TC 32-1]ETW74951.1 hypothetical protein HETIRDRAFT_332014 [Heterobasidion irregulare TC 32-1]